MAGLCDDFELKPGGTITRARFVEVLKAQLRAAAAAAEGASAGQSGGLSTAAAGSDADSPFAQGVLTGPQARLRQHTMMKQQTLQRQLSKRPDSSAGNVLAGAGGRAALGQPQMQVGACLHVGAQLCKAWVAGSGCMRAPPGIVSQSRHQTEQIAYCAQCASVLRHGRLW